MSHHDATENLQTSMLLAMRRLAKSVSVISCCHEGQRYAMSATAVDSLSTDPPSMLICVNRSASIHLPLTHGADFCVNILAASQRDTALDCAGRLKGEDRFSAGNWNLNVSSVPYLADAQASVICRQDGRFDYGTHTVFIGRIEQIFVGDTVSPLVYVDGAYTTSAPLPAQRMCA